jgi:hypothetical protein
MTGSVTVLLYNIGKCQVESGLWGLLPKSLLACSETFFDKSKACSRQCQNSPSGLKQLALLIFRFTKIYEQKTFQ